LEDLGWTKLDRLMNRSSRQRTDGHGLFPVSYGPWEVDYLPKKEFRVKAKGGKWVVINDVGTFFQCRFVEALEKWDVGTLEERELIGRGKEARGTFAFEKIEDISTYNALEIRLLEQLMEKFRAACVQVGYVPARWQGPGQLAEAMLARHNVPRTKDIPLLNDPTYADLLTFGRNAFYGGRSEIMAVGPVDRPAWQWDINSAYPYAMLDVPCLIHGEWEKLKFESPHPIDAVTPVQLGIYYGSFHDDSENDESAHRKRPLWFGLPIRNKDGGISFPAAGRGWYWSFEIGSAIHQTFMVESCWVYTKLCECRPLAFVSDVYQKRRSMGKDGAGHVLKLGLNSIFGKQVQAVGNPKYANPIWGSFFTAKCRTQVQDFIHSSPSCRGPNPWCGNDILMVATDSVCTFTERTDITPSKELGGWSVETHPGGMFIVQPGLYFGTSSKPPKTRGVPRSVIESYESTFRDAFSKMVATSKLSDGDVSVPQNMFVGIRYALHRHNLKLLGQWIEFKDPETGRTGKCIRFDWSSKRAKWPVLNPLPGVHSYIQTFPPEGDVTVETLPYSKDIGGLQLREQLRQMMEGQPDWSPAISPADMKGV
jgi:hypothetical protein